MPTDNFFAKCRSLARWQYLGTLHAVKKTLDADYSYDSGLDEVYGGNVRNFGRLTNKKNVPLRRYIPLDCYAVMPEEWLHGVKDADGHKFGTIYSAKNPRDQIFSRKDSCSEWKHTVEISTRRPGTSQESGWGGSARMTKDGS